MVELHMIDADDYYDRDTQGFGRLDSLQLLFARQDMN